MCAAPATENPVSNGSGPEAPKVREIKPFTKSLSFHARNYLMKLLPYLVQECAIVICILKYF